MKELGRSQNRYAAYHPYFPASPPNLAPFSLKTYGQHVNNSMSFSNGGLYESDGDESLPESPFSNDSEQTFVEEFTADLNAIDFSDLFNIHKYEEDEPIRCDQLQSILDQVRHESLTSLDSLDSNYEFNPRRLSENDFRTKDDTMYPLPSPPCVYTQLQPLSSPINSPSLPLTPPHLQQQPMVPQQTLLNSFECNRNEFPKTTRRIFSNTDDNNDKIRLYEFVLQLLNEKRTDCIRWLCPIEGEFEITNSSKIAKLWGDVKKNPTMTYEKFARALRHYYKLGILINYKHKEKLRYKFSQDILLKNKNALLEL